MVDLEQLEVPAASSMTYDGLTYQGVSCMRHTSLRLEGFWRLLEGCGPVSNVDMPPPVGTAWLPGQHPNQSQR